MTLKLVLLGKEGVGKTSIAMRLCNQQFNEEANSTVCAALGDTELCGKKCQIWDTAGQERFSSLTPLYYRNADVVIVVYDVTDKESFQRAQQIVETVQKENNSNIKYLIIGNKNDLKKEVLNAQGKQLAVSCAGQFMDFSAKLGNRQQIEEAINGIIGITLPKAKQNIGEVLEAKFQERKQQRGCCQ